MRGSRLARNPVVAPFQFHSAARSNAQLHECSYDCGPLRHQRPFVVAGGSRFALTGEGFRVSAARAHCPLPRVSGLPRGSPSMYRLGWS